MTQSKPILVVYTNEESKKHPLGDIEGGDWVDLYTAEAVDLYAGQYKEISLGVAIKLPEGYEAIVAPRSSLYRNWGLICPNSIGIIDNAYCGDNDVWKFPALCMKTNVHIPAGTRLCQFRILRNMPKHDFVSVSTTGRANRGGFGTTGE